MIKKVTALFQRDGLKAQAMRGALVSVMMSGGEHILRFASNLVLTRLLFPEAFGLMAMVQVILLGIQSVTTFGLRAAVVQNPRGEEPAFLNTAWTFQVLRGVALWLVVCAAAPFVAQLYNQPILTQILPVAGLAIVITGLRTTKILLAQRRMYLGQLSLLELAAQFVGLICMSLLAWQLESVWALVLGMLVQPSVAVFLHARYLPGPSNRLQWERESARDIIGLGKYLLISTIATYVIKQSDRAVLGFFISVEMLGVYGIAFALATMPVTLAQKLTSSVVFPLYRMRHPLDAPENQANIFRARRLTSAVVLSFSCLFAFVGPWLVETLYDDRYSLAGPIIVILCMANVPVVVMNNTMHVAVVKGDSLRFMLQNVATAIVQGVMIYITVGWFGIIGAGIAVSAAPLLTYPLLAYFQRRYKNWDFLGDAALILGAYGIIGLAAWIHFDQILLIPN